MKVKVEELKPKKGVLKFNDTEIYFVNTLRRAMMSDLPKLAVEDVIIYDNTSALFDEIISHRLGLIPIPTDLSILNTREECSCKGEGCPSCTVRYTLSKEGAGIVTSGDLQPEEKSWEIKEKNIPIVELYDDQRLILEVEAVLGYGREHAKWQPVQSPGYHMTNRIVFDKENKKKVKDFVENLPEKNVVDIKDEELVLKDPKKISWLRYHVDKEGTDFIRFEKNPDEMFFTFETDGALDAKDALAETANILENKYKEFRTLLKKIK
jgi:DNA-directed RNA polymerase subunit D